MMHRATRKLLPSLAWLHLHVALMAATGSCRGLSPLHLDGFSPRITQLGETRRWLGTLQFTHFQRQGANYHDWEVFRLTIKFVWVPQRYHFGHHRFISSLYSDFPASQSPNQASESFTSRHAGGGVWYHGWVLRVG